jgi:chromosome segregation ATPase
MEQIASKLNLENEIVALKRELKNVHSQLGSLKSDYAVIAALKTTIEGQIEEQKKYLDTVQDEISNAKLNWMNERSIEMDKLAQKNAEADSVIKRKAELNEQEETLRQIEAKNTDTLNETRRLELKVAADKTAVDWLAKNVEEEKLKIQSEHEKNVQDMADFKSNVLKVIKAVEKL